MLDNLLAAGIEEFRVSDAESVEVDASWPAKRAKPRCNQKSLPYFAQALGISWASKSPCGVHSDPCAHLAAR